MSATASRVLGGSVCGLDCRRGRRPSSGIVVSFASASHEQRSAAPAFEAPAEDRAARGAKTPVRGATSDTSGTSARVRAMRLCARRLQPLCTLLHLGSVAIATLQMTLGGRAMLAEVGWRRASTRL